jgi:hypothetical protein
MVEQYRVLVKSRCSLSNLKTKYMIKLKKSELEQALLQIASFNPETKEMSGGLLTENITLGTKRRLQKIHKALIPIFQEFIKDLDEVKKEAGEDKEKLNKEIEELINEEISIDAEQVSLSLIENISSEANYNFDVIEKLAV